MRRAVVGAILAASLPALHCGGFGGIDEVRIEIMSVRIEPSTQVGVGDMVTATLVLNPSTITDYAALEFSWRITSPAGNPQIVAGAAESTVTFVAPGLPCDVTVRGSVSSGPATVVAKSATVHVLDLPAPGLRWHDITDGATYLRSEGPLQFSIGTQFQNPVDSTGFVATSAATDSIVADTTVNGGSLAFPLDLSSLLGPYRIVAWAAALNDSGVTVIGRDTVTIVVNEAVCCAKQDVGTTGAPALH